MCPIKKNIGDQFITTNRMDQILGNDLKSPRRRSASTPNVITPDQYKGGTKLEQELTAILDKIIIGAQEGDIVDVMAYLMFLNSMRVSELLAIRCHEISKYGTFLIHACKGSHNRVGQPGIVQSYLVRYVGKKRYLFDEWNKRTIYYHFKVKGYSKHLPGKERASVTHLFRHASVYLLKNINAQADTIQHQLGHKSEKSGEYYGT